MSTAQGQPALSERLAGVVVGLRTELDVSRHVFHDGPAYVIRDPLSFKTHRFDAPDYEVLSRITDSTPLGEIFQGLVRDGLLDEDDSEAFYEFVLGLHRDGLLALPVNDAETLYARYRRRLDAERKGKIMGFMFLRVPLINPDAMLSATERAFRWMFSPLAFVGWLTLLVAALLLAAARWSELTAPSLTMLTGDRLALLWLVLIGLKVVHEFGHAYACKIFGGHVPEMGAFFILGTPCAYVDATDSWSFPDPMRRIIVALAGVYFESIVGACALFVWAFTEPSLLNTVAYQIVVLSTVVTVGFNLNPLMKYDGYYILSDVLRIPNLRQRASESLNRLLQRVFLGIRPSADDGAGRSLGLAGFGAALVMYKVGLTISICALIATKFYTLGIAMALFYIFSSTGTSLMKLVRFLFSSDHQGFTRWRAAAAGVALLVGVPGALALVPYEPAIDARGRLSMDQDATLRASGSGVIAEASLSSGDRVGEGAVVAKILSPDLDAAGTLAEAELQLAHARYRVASLDGAAPDADTLGSLNKQQERSRQTTDSLERLVLRAPFEGTVVVDRPLVAGRYVSEGEPIARIVSGRPRGVFYVEESAFNTSEMEVGDKIFCRAEQDPTRLLQATVVSIAPAATHDLAGTGLTTDEGGTIPVDPATSKSALAYVRVEVELPLGHAFPHDAALYTRLRGEPMPLGRFAARKIALFLNNLKSEQS